MTSTTFSTTTSLVTIFSTTWVSPQAARIAAPAVAADAPRAARNIARRETPRTLTPSPIFKLTSTRLTLYVKNYRRIHPPTAGNGFPRQPPPTQRALSASGGAALLRVSPASRSRRKSVRVYPLRRAANDPYDLKNHVEPSVSRQQPRTLRLSSAHTPQISRTMRRTAPSPSLATTRSAAAITSGGAPAIATELRPTGASRCRCGRPRRPSLDCSLCQIHWPATQRPRPW